MPSQEQPPIRSLADLGNAAVAGLMGALAIGGGYLIATAARTILFSADCGPLAASQCALEQEIALHAARRQALVGGALLLLALAIFVRLRAKFEDRFKKNEGTRL